MRQRLLNDEERARVLEWYRSVRTVSGKAKELGISKSALYDYIKGAHKNKAPVTIDRALDELSAQGV